MQLGGDIMKRLLCAILIIYLMLIPDTVYAGIRIIDNPDNPMNSIAVFDFDENHVFTFAYESKIKDNDDYPVPAIMQGGKQLKGKYTYPNYDSSKLGFYDLQWVFTPADKSIEPITGTVKARIIMPTWGTMRDEDDFESVPKFKQSSLVMQVGTSYYPQIDNNIGGSDYLWKSNNKNVVTINKKTGKLTAKGAGTATVTCTINTPYDEEFTLNMEVTVVASKETNKEIVLTSGEEYDLSVDFNSSECSVTYASSKNSIAYVEYYMGKITARNEGEAYITCTAIDTDYNVHVARYKVLVTE